MKQRIITALIGLPFLILLLFCPVPVVLAVVIAASILGMFELLRATKMIPQTGLCAVGYIGAALIPLAMYFRNGLWMQLLIYGLMIALFVMLLIYHKSVRLSQPALILFALIYVPFFLSHIVLIREMDYGRFYIWLVFLGAFSTDTFAYFGGTFFGKRKLCPEISPKKTVAGAISGLLGSGLVMVLFGLIVNACFGDSLGNGMSLIRLLILGVLCGVISEVGDLAASIIKREYDVKDFGNLLPGHGGILDRCDSILFVAPLIYLFLQMVGIFAA